MVRRALPLLVIVAAVALAGCGGDDDGAVERSRPGDTRAWMTLDVKVRPKGATAFRDSAAVRPGDVVKVKARFANRGDRQAQRVRTRADLSPGLELIGGSPRLQELTLPQANAAPLPGSLTRGVALGPYPPRGAAQLRFDARAIGGRSARSVAVRVTISGRGFRNRDEAEVFVRRP